MNSFSFRLQATNVDGKIYPKGPDGRPVASAVVASPTMTASARHRAYAARVYSMGLTSAEERPSSEPPSAHPRGEDTHHNQLAVHDRDREGGLVHVHADILFLTHKGAPFR